jgi:hypothetical protein
MKRLTCLLLSLGLLSFSFLPCRAKLGDNLDQCIARYGKPLSTSMVLYLPRENCYFFGKNDFVICAEMFKGTVAGEAILKANKTAMSDNEINAILDAESVGLSWSEPSIPSINRLYIRDDGARAVYDTMQRTLSVLTKDYLAAMTSQRRKNLQDELKDF